ncbi:transcription factor IIA, alpha/beta subunit [Thermothelomyces heterothallicus CBS 202.75]|uniref:transcription factor IIA, alpha/beta subunit n=1 Tax=Thermothelomyces heterothallicus CBS 202.75 TaxID=1149848 RepID=UPI003743A6A6
MSNAAVGPVYDTIITEVINAVRVDFEENGVDDSALEDLKKTWQHKLSQMNLAQFPWDPKPEPPPTPASANAPPASAPPSAPPITANYTQSTLSPQSSAQTLSLPGSLHPNSNSVGTKQEPGFTQAEPTIKQEPGLPPAPSGYNPANGVPPIAAQRAASALHNQYGPRAAKSIAQINSAAQQSQQNQRPGQVPQQHMNPHQQHQHQQQQQQQQQQQHLNPQQQYRQNVAAAMQQQRMQQVNRTGPNGLPTSQVDGPSDAAEAESSIIMDRAQIDELLHAQLAARAKQMEGGGLMLPLKQATKDRSVASKQAGAAGPAQFDGGLDDDGKSEDDDEDAINSDLDDPDEMGEEDDDDDDSMGHMMLCMYDKVQRVKNKWKCILKDGVLTVNGKEYVFAKATGEYEW